jgi:peptide/nickel transport system ATP-binding protein
MPPPSRAQGLVRASAVIPATLSFVDVSKRFDQLEAVSDVTFTAREGEVICLLGPSGCGKSTLARMMLGLLPATSGTARLGGQDLATLDRRVVARRMQPIFQDPYSSLNPRRRIAEIVSLPLDVQGTGSSEENRARTLATMDRVGLPKGLFQNLALGHEEQEEGLEPAAPTAAGTRPATLVVMVSSDTG